MLVKKILVATLFAVAMLGGGELPILHAPQFAEAHAFVHQHINDAHAGGYRDDGQDASRAGAGSHADHDTGDQPASDHGCTHVHAHCCPTIAITAAVATAPPVADIGRPRIERNGAIPYGQLSRPLLRPPRFAA